MRAGPGDPVPHRSPRPLFAAADCALPLAAEQQEFSIDIGCHSRHGCVAKVFDESAPAIDIGCDEHTAIGRWMPLIADWLSRHKRFAVRAKSGHLLRACPIAESRPQPATRLDRWGARIQAPQTSPRSASPAEISPAPSSRGLAPRACPQGLGNRSQ